MDRESEQDLGSDLRGVNRMSNTAEITGTVLRSKGEEGPEFRLVPKTAESSK